MNCKVLVVNVIVHILHSRNGTSSYIARKVAVPMQRIS